MKLVCGLGNPGPQYEATRHNVGWWLLDRLAVDWASGPFEREADGLFAEAARDGEVVILLKPVTFMNRSGVALASAQAHLDLDIERDLLVVVDDVALDVGRLRMRPSGSSGGHNGLKSVEASLGTADYARLRIGVGSPPMGVDLVEWVLSPFPEEDEDRILALLPDAVSAVETWVREGVEPAMSRFNR